MSCQQESFSGRCRTRTLFCRWREGSIRNPQGRSSRRRWCKVRHFRLALCFDHARTISSAVFRAVRSGNADIIQRSIGFNELLRKSVECLRTLSKVVSGCSKEYKGGDLAPKLPNDNSSKLSASCTKSDWGATIPSSNCIEVELRMILCRVQGILLNSIETF